MFRSVGALRLYSGVLALGACLVGSPRIACAESDRDRAAARAAADAGADAYDQQRYVDAVELFTRAEKLVHATPHWLFIARSLVKLGRLVEAHEAYLKIQREKLAPNAPSAFKRAQAEAEKEIQDVAPRLAYATVRVEGAPSDAVQVFMDDAELPAAVVGIAFPVDPGDHVFRAQAGADKSEAVTTRFDEGARQGVVLKITQSSRSSSSTAEGGSAPSGSTGGHTFNGVDSAPAKSRGNGLLIAGAVTAGVGAVGVGLGIYFLADSSSYRKRADDLFGQCDPRQCTKDEQAYIHDQDDTADSRVKVGLATLIPGGALAITGTVLLVMHASRGGSTATLPRTTLVGGRNWLGVQHRF